MPDPQERSPFLIAAGTTIGAALRLPPIDPLEARILLAHALQLTRVQLITQADRPLCPDDAARVSALFNRRIAGEPIAYITGEREFFGLMLYTTADVLIPRPETELLVELALERLPSNGRVLDMGTGSGAIAIAIAHSRPDAIVTALDVSAASLVIARRNAARHNANVQFVQSDWFNALGDERFDLIVSNPPYIEKDDAHLGQGDLRFEPIDALTDHDDGLGAIRRIVRGAHAHLAEGSWLLMEHGYDQASAVRGMLADHGFHAPTSWKDLAGIERITGATTQSLAP